MAMLNGFPYEQTAVVPEEEEATTVLVLEQKRYQELLLLEPGIAQALLRGLEVMWTSLTIIIIIITICYYYCI